MGVGVFRDNERVPNRCFVRGDGGNVADKLAVSTLARSTQHAARSTLVGYLRLLHPFPVAANGVAAAAFAAVAARGWAGWRTTALLVLAIVGSQAAVGAVNDLRDRDIDALVKPHKPLVSGQVSAAGASVCTGVALLVASVAGAMLGPVSLLLVAAMTAAGLVYDLWLKRTALSFLPYILGLPILPVWAWVCVRDAPPRLWLTYPLGVLVGFGLHLANALPDADRDGTAGVRGLVQVAGRRMSLVLCFGAFAFALVAAVLLAWDTAGMASVVLFVAAAVLLLWAAVAALVRPTVPVLQRNWGVLIGCAICIAGAWLASL